MPQKEQFEWFFPPTVRQSVIERFLDKAVLTWGSMLLKNNTNAPRNWNRENVSEFLCFNVRNSFFDNPVCNLTSTLSPTLEWSMPWHCLLVNFKLLLLKPFLQMETTKKFIILFSFAYKKRKRRTMILKFIKELLVKVHKNIINRSF